MDKRQLEILKKLQAEHGPEKGLVIFEQINDQVMITVEQANKDIRHEIALSNKELRTEMSISSKELRTEMNSKFEQLKSEVTQTKWTISIIVAVIAVLITAIQYFATKPH